ncbi:MAG: exodeoxyribonuclease V subunit gamma [Desulforhopalus sp.]
MFYLHVSNRTENLLLQLAEVIRVDKQVDIFAPELFLIQSQGMERMVGQTMADVFGSFCNFSFFLPLDFLSFIADKLDMGISPDGFVRQTLTWRLDGLLRDVSDEAFEPIRYYLSGDNVELKRYQLARRLANVFDQYQLMRGDMLVHWEQGRLATEHQSERWQMLLWQKLLAQPGGDVHRGVLFKRMTERLAQEQELSGFLPKRISVVGLHTMPPVFLEYLQGLAHHMDVHMFLLSPCRNYWGGTDSKKSRIERLVAGEQAGEVTSGEHPLLITLGRQGRDLQNMMLAGEAAFKEFASYDEPLTDEKYLEANILERVQADLLEGSLREVESRATQAGDNSIRVVSCHSRMRELQILKDHLLHFLHTNPALELRDIIVMAPDIQEYATLIPAVFAEIQHSIADRSVRRRNTIIDAFLKFLELLQGRFGWSEILDFLRNPVVHPQFNLSTTDLDTLQQLVVGSGIRWGLSGEQREKAGLARFDSSSWQSGLERLLMGYAIDTGEFVDGILPFCDLEGRGALPLGGLCQYIELIEEACQAFNQSCTMGEWSERLATYAEQLFGDTNETELAELRNMLRDSAECIGSFHTDPVGFTVINEWLTQSAKERRSSSGFLRGQLTFCSMLPMRSIPFPVVCLIGLNDGDFPKNDSHATFDLMTESVRPGDRSPRADDRYQFLEALMAARSNLYISYIGQSIKTNEKIPPSVVVAEFLEVLQNFYMAGDLVVSHPLQPFSRKYFEGNGDSHLFSYDSYGCRTAEKLRQRRPVTQSWWHGEVAMEQGSIHLVDLLSFFSNPQKYFVSKCLGIRLDTGEKLPEESELFSLKGLEKYIVEQELIGAGVTGSVEDCFEKIRTEGRWPLGRPGEVGFREQREEIERFIDRVKGLDMGPKIEDCPVDIDLGRYHLTGKLSNLYENGVLLLRYGKLRGRDLLAGWIHQLAAYQILGNVSTRILTPDRVVRFVDVSDGPSLERLVELFVAGSRQPLQLYVEPGYEYAIQATRQHARLSPLEKALQTFTFFLEKGYEPEWELLLGEGRVENIFGSEFERLCQEILIPILEQTDEG